MNNKNKNEKKKLITLIAVLAIVLAVLVAIMIVTAPKKSTTSGNSSNTTSQEAQPGGSSQTEDGPDYVTLEIIDTEPTDVLVTMTDGQSFTICVRPDIAPQSSQNFLNLVRDGFYDGLTFHRIIDGFMAQGGDPEGTGMGGSENNIFGEFSANGFDNKLPHKRGVVSMARSTDFNSASSQFFICYDDAGVSYLDGQYAAFGEVTQGMEVVDSFLSAGTDESDRPLKEVKIQSMTVVE